MREPAGTRRIALVASSFHPHTGGVEEHVRHVARELASMGYKVAVWTVDRGERLGRSEVDGVEVRYLPCPLPARSFGALVRFAARLPVAAWAWWSAFWSLRPDVLHVHCFGPNGVYALALHLLTRTPLVVTSHGETFADDHAVYDRSALLRKALRLAIARASAVTAPTQFVLADLRSRFGLSDGSVVPNGIDAEPPAAEHVDLPVSRPLVLAVGRVEQMKGFDLLLEAMADPQLASAHVAIGGAGSEVAALRSLAGELGLSERVRFLGRLTPGQVTTAMASADVVVVPSRREAFGIVALEAWRSGTPLVGTVQGGMPEVVTGGIDGLLVDPTDVTALSAALRRLIRDGPLRARLVSAGRQRVEDYAWSRVAATYAECYRGVS